MVNLWEHGISLSNVNKREIVYLIIKHNSVQRTRALVLCSAASNFCSKFPLRKQQSSN